MNWLAHLHLAPPGAEGWLGALLGDAGPVPADLPPAVRAAVEQHRRIDAFTDRHPCVRRSRQRLSPDHRHYRAVLVDVFYDHFLSASWARWSDEPLAAFVARVFAALDPLEPTMPDGLRRLYPRLRDSGWLLGYGSDDGLRDVLQRMSRRLRRGHDLSRGLADLRAHRTALAADFAAFYPELAAAAGC